MSEFTGKSRRVYRVRVSLEEVSQVEHVSEGWMPQPGVQPVEISTVQEGWADPREAEEKFRALKAELLML